MTKEEIIDAEFCGTMFEKLNETELKLVKDAMDEWAKQEAVGFAEWIRVNDWLLYGGSSWRRTEGGVIIYKTTGELYNLYLTNKDK